MNMLDIAQVPAIVIAHDKTVLEAVDISIGPRVGAVVVTRNDQMVGILTERDVMFKVVHGRLDPAKTLVSEVMSSPPVFISRSGTIQEAFKIMAERHIRHLPISEDGVSVEGVLSIRNVLHSLLDNLEKHTSHLEAYVVSGLSQ